MQDSARTETRVAFEAGLAAAEPKELKIGEIDSSLLAYLAPWGAEVKVIDPQQYLPNPRRAQGTVNLATVESFMAYVQDQELVETTVWVSIEQGRAVAVLNDNTPVEEGDPDTRVPGWGDHRAVLAFKQTPEWAFWKGKDGQLMNQQEFAEHIEDGAKEIVAPDSATMLEVAQSFQAKNNVQFRSGLRLDSGETRFLYDEQLQAQAGKKGELQVPTEFELGIAPFEGEPPYRVGARLRWRLRSGDLSIGYKLDRPQDVTRDALGTIADRLKQVFPRTFIGEPR